MGKKSVLLGILLIAGMVLALPVEVQEYVKRGGEVTIEALKSVFNVDYRTAGSWIVELKDKVSLLQYNIGYLLAEGFTVAAAVKCGLYALVAGLAVYDAVKVWEFVSALVELRDIKRGIVEARRKFSEDYVGISGFGVGVGSAIWGLLVKKPNSEGEYYLYIHFIDLVSTGWRHSKHFVNTRVVLTFDGGWVDYYLEVWDELVDTWLGMAFNSIVDTVRRDGFPEEGQVVFMSDNYDLMEDKSGDREPIHIGKLVFVGDEAVERALDDESVQVISFDEEVVRRPDPTLGYKGEVVQVSPKGAKSVGSVSVDMSGLEMKLDRVVDAVEGVRREIKEANWIEKLLAGIRKVFFDEERVDEELDRLKSLIDFREELDLRVEVRSSGALPESVRFGQLEVRLPWREVADGFGLRQLISAFLIAFAYVSLIRFVLDRMVI